MPSLRRRRSADGRMPLAEHLKEFRNRLIVAAIAVVLCAAVGWYYYAELFDLLLDPVRAVRDSRGESLVNLNFGASITQPFAVQLRVAIFVGIVLASPVWIWQIWGFLLPGLRRKERRTALAFFLASVPLFLAGCVLAAWALPRTVAVLLSFTPEGAANLQDAMTYLNFILYFIVAFGIAFLMPVLLVGANSLRILPAATMLKGWRIATLLILVFCALATPDPSAWTMLALAAPMVVLYFLAVGVATLLERARRRREPEWTHTPDDQASDL